VVDVLWRRYHSWGKLRAEVTGPTEALARATGLFEDEGVAAFVAGALEQVVEISGGVEVVVEPTSRELEYRIVWAIPDAGDESVGKAHTLTAPRAG
jgi:uncharacterized protein (TIGR02265 family)